MIYYNHFKTYNTPSGKPRRGIEAYDADGNFIKAVRFSYVDTHEVIQRHWPNEKAICLSGSIFVQRQWFNNRFKEAVEEI